MSRLRWAFNISTWRPNEAEWQVAINSIQSIEKDRILKFVFKDDQKRSLIGRLALRAAISHSFNIPWTGIELARTEKGKPYLSDAFQTCFPETSKFQFNISHHGDYVVLASEPESKVGVDIMKIEPPRGSQTLNEFFYTMRKQFTPFEWSIINKPIENNAKMSLFYRFWALKESFLKATGSGILLDLQFLEFHIKQNLLLNTLVNTTCAYINGHFDSGWVFEECMIDGSHIATVATYNDQRNKDKDTTSSDNSILVFQVLPITQLIQCIS